LLLGSCKDIKIRSIKLKSIESQQCCALFILCFAIKLIDKKNSIFLRSNEISSNNLESVFSKYEKDT